MIPLNLNDAVRMIESQNLNLPLVQWRLPDIKDLILYIDQLLEEEELTINGASTLLKELDDLSTCWYEALKDFAHDGLRQISYKKLKKACLDRFLEKKNACLEPEGKPKSRNSTALVSSWSKLLSRALSLPLKDIRAWLRNNVPGIQRLWHDPDQGYYVVGGLSSPKQKILRQPSIRQWHALQGRLDTELLTALVDVDWVRINQLAGNPCVATLVNRWKECQSEPDEALRN